MPKTYQVSSPYMLEASIHISTQESLSKNQEELQKEIKINNATLKQEIETKVPPDMEARLNIKINAISKIEENKKAKNHCQQQSSSNMSLSSSSSSKRPSNRKAKGNQYRPHKVYPPKEKIELSKCNRSEDQCVAWLNKAEEYFDIYNIQFEEDKVKYASMHMEGYA